jgi:hypothetical protein
VFAHFEGGFFAAVPLPIIHLLLGVNFVSLNGC